MQQLKYKFVRFSLIQQLFFFTLCHFFQGILLEHREKEFGDKVNMLAVLRAARQIQDNMSS